MRVSIAMATYNGAVYLEQQLDSFRLQERLPDELVVSDDCSTDETPAILDSFAATAPFSVRVSRSPATLGYTRNFAAAMSACTGDIVFLSDQDDYWFSSKIAAILSLAENNPDTQVFMNDAELTDEHLGPTGLTKLGQIHSAWMPDEAFVQGSCVAVRREFLDMVLPVPPAGWSHDAWIVTFARGLNRLRVVPQTLQYYRRHSTNVSQFVVNQPRRLPRPTLLRQRLARALRADAAEVLAGEQARTEVLAERVGTLLGQKDPAPVATGDLQRLCATLAARIRILRKRAALLEISRIRRVPRVTRMLFRGEYSRFGGLRTAGRDLLAP